MSFQEAKIQDNSENDKKTIETAENSSSTGSSQKEIKNKRKPLMNSNRQNKNYNSGMYCPSNQYLPNPNAQFSRPNKRMLKNSNKRRLQNEIQTALLTSLSNATPDQAKKVSVALTPEIDQKCRKIAEYLFINNPQNMQMGFNQFQRRNPSQNEIMQLQYNQFLQMNYQNEMQFNMLMQTSSLFMQQMMQMKREQDESESSSSSDSDSDESSGSDSGSESESDSESGSDESESSSSSDSD